jgi:hypothetical protein
VTIFDFLRIPMSKCCGLAHNVKLSSMAPAQGSLPSGRAWAGAASGRAEWSSRMMANSSFIVPPIAAQAA